MNIEEDNFKEMWMNAKENKDYIPVNTKWYNLEEVKYWKNHYKQLGIKEQIENCEEYKEFKPGSLTESMLKEFIEEIFFNRQGKLTEMEDCILFYRSKDEVYTWKDKIKEGYLYKCGGSKMTFITGFGGAINYGNELEKMGFSNEQIEEDIQITETEGIRTDTVFVPIKYITWHKIDKNESYKSKDKV